MKWYSIREISGKDYGHRRFVHDTPVPTMGVPGNESAISIGRCQLGKISHASIAKTLRVAGYDYEIHNSTGIGGGKGVNIPP